MLGWLGMLDETKNLYRLVEAPARGVSLLQNAGV